jgi:hypothetical protein
VLADLSERAVGSFIGATAHHRGHDTCPYPAEFGGQITVGMLTAIRVFEYLLHGADMAFAVGRDWSGSEPAADTAVAMMTPFLLRSGFDSEAAGDLDASFAVDTPGGRFSNQVRSGGIKRLDEGVGTDCSISGASSHWLLWLSGRSDWEDSELSASCQRAHPAKRFASSFPTRRL